MGKIPSSIPGGRLEDEAEIQMIDQDNNQCHSLPFLLTLGQTIAIFPILVFLVLIE